MTSKESMYFTVRLAEINGASTVDGRIYKMDKEKLKQFMDKQVGKPMGEINTSAINAMSGDLTARLDRIETVDPLNSVGTLQGYDIDEDGERLIVTGYVDFSPAMKETLEAINDRQPTFGLRALGKPSTVNNSFQIDKLISFDYVDPSRRL